MKCAACIVLLLLCGCASIPEGVRPVKNFNPDRYLGTWYEIARLDNRFERGLTHCRADYSLNDNGTIRVVNRGYDPKEQEWKKAVGKARLADSPDIGRLKVSFFGPFYAGYNIIDLDDEYSRVLVCGGSKDYLWILARSRTLPDSDTKPLVEKARKLGFETDELIFVDQSAGIPDPP
jgi:apolipoprotein D and lipocalin family protein